MYAILKITVLVQILFTYVLAANNDWTYPCEYALCVSV